MPSPSQPPVPTPLKISATRTPFPARTKQIATFVGGVRTEVWSTSFADKIFVGVSMGGGLGHWVHVPLASADPTNSSRRPAAPITYDDEVIEAGSELLPLPHLTATTLLGAGAPERDTLGQLLATQLATAIVTRNPEEKRLLVLGMGLGRDVIGVDEVEARETFIRLVGLCVAVV